jgi:hypothetical protein
LAIENEIFLRVGKGEAEMIKSEMSRSRDAGQQRERRNTMTKRLGIAMVIVGIVMMGAASGSAAADIEEMDIAVIRGRQGQYVESASSGEPQIDVAVIRGRQGWTFEAASYSEPRLDVAVVRARGGQYVAAACAEPQVDVAVIRGRQGWTPKDATYGAPRLDITVVRALGGQFAKAAGNADLQLDIVVIRGRQHRFLQGAMASRLAQSGRP